MNDLTMLIAIALAGGVGAVLRYVVDNAVPARWRARYPWGTTVVNVTGAFIMGMLVGLTEPTDTLRAVVGVGLLGGYTTFSTASLETVRLLGDRRGRAALANSLGMLAATIAAALVGIALTT